MAHTQSFFPIEFYPLYPSVEELTDVTVTTPVVGESLIISQVTPTVQWVNGNPPVGSVGPTTPTTFPAGAVIFSGGTTLAYDPAFTYIQSVGQIQVQSILSEANNAGAGICAQYVNNVNTTSNAVTPVLTFALDNSSVFCVQVFLALLDTLNATNNGGTISYIALGSVDNLGNVTIPPLVQYFQSLQANVNTVYSTVTSGVANELYVNVIGNALPINWIVSAKVLTQL